MLQNIGRALLYGYQPRVILNQIARQYPQHASKIHAAQTAGYASDQILQYLSEPNKKGRDSEEYLTDKEKIQKRDAKRKKRTQMAIAGSLIAGGLIGQGSNLLAARNAPIQPNAILPAGPQPRIPPQLPGPRQRGIQQALPSPMVGPQGGPPPNAPAGPQPQGSQNTPTAQIQQPPQAPLTNPLQSVQIVKNLREEDRFNNIIANNQQDARTIAQMLKAVIPKSKIALFEKAPGGFEQVVNDYMQVMQQSQQQQSQVQPSPQQMPTEVIIPPIQPQQAKEGERIGALKEFKEKQKKSSFEEEEIHRLESHYGKPQIQEAAKNVVITPQGVGEIKHEGKKGTIAKVNGKEKSFFPEDIEKPSENVIEAVANILQIPEVDRSSNIALFTYDPDEEKMYIQFHDGNTYKYLGVEREKMQIIADKLHIPITEGQNMFGAWSPEDKNSLGASFFQEILKDPKYAKPKKGEPPNPNYKKLETMYDYWEKLRKQPKRKNK